MFLYNMYLLLLLTLQICFGMCVLRAFFFPHSSFSFNYRFSADNFYFPEKIQKVICSIRTKNSNEKVESHISKNTPRQTQEELHYCSIYTFSATSQLLVKSRKDCHLMKPLSELRQFSSHENSCFSLALLYLPGFTKVSAKAYK